MNELNELADVRTYFFADETKFSISNGEPENAIYYFVIGCSLEMLLPVRKEFGEILASKNIDTFHAADIFKEKSFDAELILSITDLLTKYSLQCFCFRYHKDRVYEAAKVAFSYLNKRQEIDFENSEYQALFFLVQAFETYLNSHKKLIEEKGIIFFDRNVYGKKDTEGYDFEENGLIKRMIFLQKGKIDLLALPDFLVSCFENQNSTIIERL